MVWPSTRAFLQAAGTLTAAPLLTGLGGGMSSSQRTTQLDAGDCHTKLVLLGTAGGPAWYPESNRASTSSALVVGDAIYLIDLGHGATQRMVEAFAKGASAAHLIVLCGHYEGVDHRVVEALVDQEISIGDYVLTNGAIAATVFVDAVVRLIPGVLGDERSPEEESFSEGLLEAPCYTRPPEFRGMKVPDVLLSGHHAELARWRRKAALYRTWERRPDLLQRAQLSEADKSFLRELEAKHDHRQNSSG